jgi:phosphopantothenoylcysteine synthetase/decarboxylase
MHFLVTAGNTQTPIDRVRCLTNIFTGLTGANIAWHAHNRGHHVILMTSHPKEVMELRPPGTAQPAERWVVQSYRTFDDLHQMMARTISQGGLDVIIHCAAISDYTSAGIYAPAPGTRFLEGRWVAEGSEAPTLIDRAAGKVKSDEAELWLRLVRAPKLVDRIRSDWGFRGTLVKFKLEVGISDEQLLEIAERSRRHSDADLMVANTLEGAISWAFLGPVDGSYQRIERRRLGERLLDVLESLPGKSTHG